MFIQLFVSVFQLEKDETAAWDWIFRRHAFFFCGFLFLPPLWALGIYFALWHSLRHGLRIIWLDPTGKQDWLQVSI